MNKLYPIKKTHYWFATFFLRYPTRYLDSYPSSIYPNTFLSSIVKKKQTLLRQIYSNLLVTLFPTSKGFFVIIGGVNVMGRKNVLYSCQFGWLKITCGHPTYKTCKHTFRRYL
jgi:hypothetical protein